MKLTEAIVGLSLLGTPQVPTTTPLVAKVTAAQHTQIAQAVAPVKPPSLDVHRYLMQTDKNYQDKLFNLRVDIFKEAEKTHGVLKRFPDYKPAGLSVTTIALDFLQFVVSTENRDYTLEEFQQFHTKIQRLQAALEATLPLVSRSSTNNIETPILASFFDIAGFIHQIEQTYGVNIEPVLDQDVSTNHFVLTRISPVELLDTLSELLLRLDREEFTKEILQSLGLKKIRISKKIILKGFQGISTNFGGTVPLEDPSTVCLRYWDTPPPRTEETDSFFHELIHVLDSHDGFDFHKWFSLHPGKWKHVDEGLPGESFQETPSNKYVRYFIDDTTPLYKANELIDETGADFHSCDLTKSTYGACGMPPQRMYGEDIAYTGAYLLSNLYRAKEIYGKNPILSKTSAYILQQIQEVIPDKQYLAEKEERDRLEILSTYKLTPQDLSKLLAHLRTRRENMQNLARRHGGYIPHAKRDIWATYQTELEANQFCSLDPNKVNGTCLAKQAGFPFMAFLSDKNIFWWRGLGSYAKHHATMEELRGNPSFAKLIPSVADFRTFF